MFSTPVTTMHVIPFLDIPSILKCTATSKKLDSEIKEIVLPILFSEINIYVSHLSSLT